MKVKVKDFNPKYETIELLVYKTATWFIAIGTVELQKLKRIYDEYYVYSYKYFEDTKSTSVIIGKEPKYDCKEDTTSHWKVERSSNEL